MKMFIDSTGKMSSFRVVWVIFVLTIVFSWGYVCVSTKKIEPLPLDGLTMLALLGVSPLKTFSEKGVTTTGNGGPK